MPNNENQPWEKASEDAPLSSLDKTLHTHGLFLFQIRDAFYQLGKEAVNMQPHEIESHVKQQLEERAYDTYHSLMWKEAENIALSAFADGYRHNGYSHY